MNTNIISSRDPGGFGKTRTITAAALVGQLSKAEHLRCIVAKSTDTEQEIDRKAYNLAWAIKQASWI